jgi:hypothetical protein
MYIDRVLMNDIVMRVFFLWKDNGYLETEGKWLSNIIDIHVAIFNISDFSVGCITLYLTYWFSTVSQR